MFLDLPQPWEAILHAKESFKERSIGRICCFSPCIEQVQKNAEALRKHGFIEIQTVEILVKHFYPHENYYALPLPLPEVAPSSEPNAKKRKLEALAANSKKELTLKADREMKGHTSYLTFATLLPVYEELVLQRTDNAGKDAEEAGDDEDQKEEGEEEEADAGAEEGESSKRS